MDTILTIAALTKTYASNIVALNNCSFSLKAGTICAIVGESGGGKSTLLRLIAGLERPSSGSVEIEGKIMSSDSLIVAPQKRNIGFVFQDFALFPHLTVEQNIAFGLSKNKAKIVQEQLKLIKMEGYEKSYPANLSGGQQQRVAIARTLATAPKLLLLDEPFSNLDTSLKTNLRQDIQQIVKELGITVLFITHDLLDATDIADEVVLMQKGEVLEHRPIERFLKAPETKEAQRIISELKQSAVDILKLIP